jgi:hypothetical protein
MTHTRYQLGENVMQQQLEDVLVLMQLGSGLYFELNDSGRITLQTLLAGGDEAACTDALRACFDIDANTAMRDVMMLITELCERELIERV